MNNNNLKLINKLGNYYYNKKDYKQAKLYFKICILNNLYVYYKLAKCYEVELKYDKSVKYYKLAVEKGTINAMNNLGIYYDEIKDDEKCSQIL